MKRYLSAFLCACALVALSAVAFASDVTQYTDDEWKALYGIPEPRYEDFEESAEYAAAFDAWFEGYAAFIISTTQAQEEAARLAAEAEAARQSAEGQASPAPVETTPTKPIESAGSNDGNSGKTMDDDTPDKYPLGSYVDPSGIVWSPDGTRLSPDIPPDTVSDPVPDEKNSLLFDGLVNSENTSAAASLDALSLTVGTASDTAPDSPVWYVEDLRPADSSEELLSGLKSLVKSIFGEYTPVTTTSVISETVGNDTRQYLVETVAPGAAGVDYEWLSGVFLFGIMLFCLMKLLGGILK